MAKKTLLDREIDKIDVEIAQLEGFRARLVSARDEKLAKGGKAKRTRRARHETVARATELLP